MRGRTEGSPLKRRRGRLGNDFVSPRGVAQRTAPNLGLLFHWQLALTTDLNLAAHLVHFLTALFVSLWWGGLTVYAAIVVPIGSDVFGATDQGFVTQQVTHWLNGLAAAALLLSAWRVFTVGPRWLRATWLSLSVALLALLALHVIMDGMLDAQGQSIIDTEQFYGIHRWYLLVTAGQWLAGIALLYGIWQLPGAGGSGAGEPGERARR